MPFMLAAFTALFYLPYIVFKKVNDDIMRLKLYVQKGATEDVVLRFFNQQKNKKLTNRGRVGLNIVIKILYILSSLLVFLFANKMLYWNFHGLGTEVNKWGLLSNMDMYNYRWIGKLRSLQIYCCHRSVYARSERQPKIKDTKSAISTSLYASLASTFSTNTFS